MDSNRDSVCVCVCERERFVQVLYYLTNPSTSPSVILNTKLVILMCGMMSWDSVHYSLSIVANVCLINPSH